MVTRLPVSRHIKGVLAALRCLAHRHYVNNLGPVSVDPGVILNLLQCVDPEYPAPEFKGSETLTEDSGDVPLDRWAPHAPMSDRRVGWTRTLPEGAGRMSELLAFIHRCLRLVCAHVWYDDKRIRWATFNLEAVCGGEGASIPWGQPGEKSTRYLGSTQLPIPLAGFNGRDLSRFVESFASNVNQNGIVKMVLERWAETPGEIEAMCALHVTYASGETGVTNVPDEKNT